MYGNLFAIGMIAMLIGAVAVIHRGGSRPTIRSALIGFLLALVIGVFLELLNPPHFCRRGSTGSPAWLAGALSGLVYALVRSRRKVMMTIAALMLSGFLLVTAGSSLVHELPYVGNPNWPKYSDQRTRPVLKVLQSHLVEKSQEKPKDLVLPAGWIETSWKQATGEDDFFDWSLGTRDRVGSYWHTWFTGLYHLQEMPVGIWCPGGPVTECADRLEIRERAAP